MVHYHLAELYGITGDIELRSSELKKAQTADSYLCFPHRSEDMLVLQRAIETNNNDAMARYYLGCLLYDKKRYNEATELWERSAELNPVFSTVYRNLSLAYYNKYNSSKKALNAMEKAFALDKSDARVLMELDQLYKKTGKSPVDRLSFLEQYTELVESRDDLQMCDKEVIEV